MGAALPWIAVAASVAGTLQSANAQSNALQYQAQVARNNATIANEYATRSLQAGDVQAENAMEETSQRQGCGVDQIRLAPRILGALEPPPTAMRRQPADNAARIEQYGSRQLCDLRHRNLPDR